VIGKSASTGNMSILKKVVASGIEIAFEITDYVTNAARRLNP